ncbi:MAG: methylmalonyl-CoA mutase family protein [Ilumatobacteraceae bacterium]
MTADESLTLAAEFPAPTEEQWTAQVAKALDKTGGLAPEAAIAKLTSTTYDGLRVDPLYVPGDTPAPAIATRHGDWQIRQPVHPCGDERLALEELEKGAAAVLLDLRDEDDVDATRLRTLLDGVLLDLAPVALRTGPDWEGPARALLEVYGDIQPSGAVLGADPLGHHLAGTVADVADDLRRLGALAASVQGTGVRVAVADGTRFDDAGASEAQVLGATVGAALAYVRALTEAGIPLATAFGQIELQLPATADQFATIALFRAARQLWARVAEVLEVPGAAASTGIHATTSRAMLTAYDPWVNLLRDTVACFAAGVGGADSIAVLPYDELIDRPDRELGRRLARNTQSILAMESSLGRVADPGAGSAYVEALTAGLAAAGWAFLQEIEAVGGFAAAVDNGSLAGRFAATWVARERNLDTRRDPITGVSEFPNIDEPAPAILPSTGTGGLPVHRRAERFEGLRAAVDAASAAGDRPTVFLAAIGTPAQSTARVTFAKNFFEVAGIRTINGPDTADPAAIAAAFTASGAATACLCSSDPTYAEHGVAVTEALRSAGAERIYVAGRPRDVMDALTAAGVTGSIYVGCDVHATLADLARDLGVTS